MKKCIAVILALVLVLSATACSNFPIIGRDDNDRHSGSDTDEPIAGFAAGDYDRSGTCGENVRWGFVEETGELVIFGTGEMDHYDHDMNSGSDTPWHGLEINSVSIQDGVTNIGIYAFAHIDTLTEVSISNSVTDIGNHAFYDCSNLAEINIPDSVTFIGSFAFCYCSALTRVDLPNRLSDLGMEAFYCCSGLTEITIPDGVTNIGPRTFMHCTGLTEVILPDSITNIRASAFYGCNSLTDVYYGGTQAQWDSTEIDNYNGNLTSATIHFNS